MIKSIFGFKLGSKEESKEVLPSFAPPVLDDGALTITAAANYGISIDLDTNYKNEIELITRYREMAMQPEVEAAIDDIINEAVLFDDTNPKALDLNLENLKLSDKIKKAIEEEFKNVLTLLNFRSLGQDIFRRYYVDGRLNYHIIVDQENPGKGIQELRYIDPRKLTKIREVKKAKDPMTGVDIVQGVSEYYIYSDQITNKANQKSGVKIATDSIISVTSGLMDSKRTIVLSYIHKAIKPLNQLRMIEDASIIYKLSRAPERRIFYIDVGNLPKMKAEQYMKDIMTKYKNKVVYDACLDLNTKIPLLDGRTLTLSEISEEYDSGKELWTYSCDPETGKFAPGLISWAGITRKDEPVLKLTLDNNEEIICTFDHKFPVWGKGKVEAHLLQVGDSMIPFYRKEESIVKGKSTYEKIFKNDTGKWEFTHREISKWKDLNNLDNEYLFNEEFINEPKFTVHHINYNRYDNSPNNLTKMSKLDHFSYHQQHCSLAGKIGGKISAQIQKENGIGIFGLTQEQRIENGKIYGKLGGTKSFENKSGIHGLSKEETILNSTKGNLKLQELLKDENFNKQYGEKISLGFSPESKLKMIERGKSLPKDHFTAMNALANIKRWDSDNSEKNREKLSQSQSTLYQNEFYEEIKICANLNLSLKETIVRINLNSSLISTWRELNKEQKIKNRNINSLIITNKDIKRLISKFKFSKWNEYKESIIYKNHKIVKIEYLTETMDVGTLTIDRDEIYHDYHTFALGAGIYTCNSTGEVRDDRRYLSMQEDFWLPRRDGKNTEITTLPSSAAFDDMSMVEYFEKKVYKALNVPYSRLQQPDQGFSIGRSQEISRDEIKFSKFISRLRCKFSDIFDQALRVQCVLKGICTPEEYEEFKQEFIYDWKKDNNYAELKESELIANRVTLLGSVDPYLGKYFDLNWVQHKVLNMNEDEIKEIAKGIEKDIKNKVYVDNKLQVEQEMLSMQPETNSEIPEDQNIPNQEQNIQDQPASTQQNNGNPYYNE